MGTIQHPADWAMVTRVARMIEGNTLTSTDSQKTTMEWLLQHRGLVLEGKTDNQATTALREIFSEEDVPLSASCAKRLINAARKAGLLVREPKGFRTLTTSEREERSKIQRRWQRGKRDNTVPAYRNNARAGAAA